MKTVRIANGQGFWGDNLEAPYMQVTNGPIDYLTLDYLAELTMSILKKQKLKNPEEGYARDFVSLMERILPICIEKGIKVVTNAGGVNPTSCKEKVLSVAKKLGISDLNVATILGDDIFEQIPEMTKKDPLLFANLDDGSSFHTIQDKVICANAYFGSFPIAEALQQGADVVITGRTSDPSLVLGPLVYEFGWSEGDYDQLAAGTIAGHILECGAQATGGNFQGGWEDVPDLTHVGYPIAEFTEDGNFVITKHEGTGGLVSVPTVTEQILYELGDPQNYISPDVIADFTSLKLRQVGENRVLVEGAKGRPATEFYKVSMAYYNGYITSAMLTYAWPKPLQKAQKANEILMERIKELNLDFDAVRTDYIGYNAVHGSLSPNQGHEPIEVVLRVAVRGYNRDHQLRFGMELAPLLTGPAGTTGFIGGRAKPSQIVAYWPTLIPKDMVNIQVQMEVV